MDKHQYKRKSQGTSCRQRRERAESSSSSRAPSRKRQPTSRRESNAIERRNSDRRSPGRKGDEKRSRARGKEAKTIRKARDAKRSSEESVRKRRGGSSNSEEELPQKRSPSRKISHKSKDDVRVRKKKKHSDEEEVSQERSPPRKESRRSSDELEISKRKSSKVEAESSRKRSPPQKDNRQGEDKHEISKKKTSKDDAGISETRLHARKDNHTSKDEPEISKKKKSKKEEELCQERSPARKDSRKSKDQSKPSKKSTAKDDHTKKDTAGANPEKQGRTQSKVSQVENPTRLQSDVSNAETGHANSSSAKPVVDIAALKKRLEEDRNKLSIMKEHHEWQQHKEAESNAEVREKEFYQGAPGETIGPEGKFKIEERLGQGHFANVFRCKDVQDGEDYAVKILRASGIVRRAAEEEASMCRWVHEEARRKELDGIHHIVNIVGQEFEHAGHLCLVFGLLKPDLRCICEKINKGRGLPAASLQRYATNLFSALRLLQRVGIVHTDIKPDNLLVSRGKDRRGLDYVQLIDFGSAKKLDSGSGAAPEGITFAGYVSPRFYRAPEVFLGQSYDTQVDVWGAGTTLFEMATGKILFEGNSTSNAMIHAILKVSGQFSVMFSSRGKHSTRHFNRSGDFLLIQDDSSARRIPMSEFARPQRLIADDLEKYMSFGQPEGPPDLLLRRLSDAIETCLAVDPIHRSTAEGALELDFFKKGSRR